MWKFMIAVIVLVMLSGCSLFRGGAQTRPSLRIQMHADAIETLHGSGDNVDLLVEVGLPVDIKVEVEGEEVPE